MLPAHAGMVPGRPPRRVRRSRAPRARGDGPSRSARPVACSSCSPRTRGWSQHTEPRRRAARVLPAHAGMVPHTVPPGCQSAGAPRARGDGPVLEVNGMTGQLCSPRTRGWSRSRGQRHDRTAVLPAHAGMVPRCSTTQPSAPSAPRARGDGPLAMLKASGSVRCSPRTRGWSPLYDQLPDEATVLPAHAGMVPRGRPHPMTASCAPRARGDGPSETSSPPPASKCSRARGDGPLLRKAVQIGKACSPRTRGCPGRLMLVTYQMGCSPRTRGWSRAEEDARNPHFVLPAHAGMVPVPCHAVAAARSAPRARGDRPDDTGFDTAADVCSPRTGDGAQFLRHAEADRRVLHRP